PAANFDSKGVAVSPDGLSAYVTSLNWNMLLAFDRNATTGALTLKPGAAGCFADAAMTPCATTADLLFAASPVVVSPDGRDVYTGSAFSSKPNVAAFARAQPPVAATVAPASGTTAGGTTVVITGTHLDGATLVLFGGTGAVIKESTYERLTVVAPLHVAGKVDIRVTTANGTGTFADAFTYVLPGVRSVVVAARPKVSYSRTTITFRTIVTVNAAGVVNQTFSRIVKGRRVVVCTRRKTVARAGRYPVVCVAGLTTRNAAKRGRITLRVLTSFAATRTAAVSTAQNLILPRHR
ncbi:MAG: IPT/TIG domain-containing protein, partial [Gaiellales bacterium]